ncbi:S8 family serine peptidase [Streptomyces sp. NPDC007818]|uniref:S8 family serine peptidase n=1 Tax=Streptomyces sp. NPDC007818 TaxID=3364780 RepID=UPI0036A6125E
MHKSALRALSITVSSVTLLGLAAAVPAAVAATPSPKTPQADVIATTRLVVGYKPGTQEARSNSGAVAHARGKSEASGEELEFERRTGTGAAVFSLGGRKSKAEVSTLMAEFSADPNVAYVEPELIARPLAVSAAPNDTDYAKQWDLFEAAGGMNVPGAWSTTTGAGIDVAVLDTGYVAHGDLAGTIRGGYDFISSAATARDSDGRDADPADEGDWYAAGECGDPVSRDSSWHGTHVAGTIGAVTGNRQGIAGIAHGAKIQPVRVLGKCGGGSVDIADAITWASGGKVPGVPDNPNPAEIINMSLGGPRSTCPSTYQNAIDGAVARGTTIVVAAGNSDMDVAGYSPANCDNVITVASTSREGEKAFYSNFGARIDISAPGGETRRSFDTPGTVTTPDAGILSTVNTGRTTPTAEAYKPNMGTSMAAPHIAGLAALMKAARPTLTPAQIENTLKVNARRLPGTCWGGCGAGIADAAKTVADVVDGVEAPADPKTFTNSGDVNIPDNATHVTSSIVVTGVTGNAPSQLKVAVGIKHTCRNNLVVELVAPDGTARRLNPSVFGSCWVDLFETYVVNASSSPANGTWKLRVLDKKAGHTGFIDSWSLTF